LTHPEAGATARASLDRQVDGLAVLMEGEDARLRAALVTSVMLGVTVGYQLLEVEALRQADPEEIARLLRPALRAITGQ
ncbi:MAG: TetR/AcrR family transcriptional regulator, partial [Nonomuraea sp.]|nr:TetR/AcrR family transcriptional regulator [Nonomuraea sp.]